MKVGHPSPYNEVLKERMIELYEQGKTDKQVAEIIGVCEKTISNWKGRHPEFLQALRESKQIADDLVEASLFSRAVGYSHTEEKVFCCDGEIVTHEIIKQYPPDTAAAALWLKNRQPDKWRDRQEIEHSGPDGGPIQINKVDLEERLNQIKEKE